MQSYFQNIFKIKLKITEIYSINNLPKIKDGGNK